MKKVLHVSHSLDTGGGPLYIKKIVQDIPSVHHYVAGNTGQYFTFFGKTLGASRLLKLSGKNVIANILKIRRFCSQHEIHVLHCHGRGASLYCRLLKIIAPQIQIVYTIHGFHPGTLTGLTKIAYIAFEKILFRLSRAVITVSLSEHHRFLDIIRPIQTQRVHYIPNYIAEGDVSRKPSPVTLSPNRVNLIYVGRLSSEKGIDILVAAWPLRKDKQAHLYVVGYGPMETNVVTAEVEDSGITYLGKIENASSILTHFSGIVIPSRVEGMPFIGLESMILRIPVMATPAVGITDLFDQANAYMAAGFSPTQLTEAMDRFVIDFKTNGSAVETKTNLAFKKAQAEFSPENALKLKKIYDDL
jgi:glycosyltransferase involved in cell wall biosynthesis